MHPFSMFIETRNGLYQTGKKIISAITFVTLSCTQKGKTVDDHCVLSFADQRSCLSVCAYDAGSPAPPVLSGRGIPGQDSVDSGDP